MFVVEAHRFEFLVVDEFVFSAEAVHESAELVFYVVARGLLCDPGFERTALLFGVDVVKDGFLVLFNDLVDMPAVSLELELLRILF